MSFRFLLFSSCPLFFSFRPALVLPCLLSCSLSCFLGFVGWFVCLVGVLFLFPLRTIRKKGRAVLVRPLSSCCGLLYLRIAAAFLSATAAALWHSWSDPKNGGICGNSGIYTIKQSFKGCFSIFANLNDFITWKFRIYLHPSEPRTRIAASGANIFQSYFLSPFGAVGVSLVPCALLLAS